MPRFDHGVKWWISRLYHVQEGNSRYAFVIRLYRTNKPSYARDRALCKSHEFQNYLDIAFLDGVVSVLQTGKVYCEIGTYGSKCCNHVGEVT